MARGTVSTAKSQTSRPFIWTFVEAFGQRLFVHGPARATGGNLDMPASPTVTAQSKVHTRIVLARLRQQDCPGAVAEVDAGPAILPIDDFAECVRADDERVSIAARVVPHHPLCDIQTEYEARDYRIHAEGRALSGGDAELLLNQTCHGRLDLVLAMSTPRP